MLTITQFAERVGKSRQRVHQLRREGRIRPAPILVGSYFLVHETAKIIYLTTVKGRRRV